MSSGIPIRTQEMGASDLSLPTCLVLSLLFFCSHFLFYQAVDTPQLIQRTSVPITSFLEFCLLTPGDKMLLNILDPIPVVGHVKGFVHYVVGDVDEAKKAITESTRSTVVMGSGALGLVAGPPTAATLGLLAGAMWDGMESQVTGDPTGVAGGVRNIVKGDLLSGFFQTAVTMGADAFGGVGGAYIRESVQVASRAAARTAVYCPPSRVTRSAAMQVMKREITMASVTSTTARIGAKQVVGSGGAPQKNPGPSPPPNQQQQQSSGPSSSGSGQEPPRQNPTQSSQQDQEDSLDKLLALFGVQSLEEISIRGQHIFKGLNEKQKMDLRKILNELMERGTLEGTIILIRNIFYTVDLGDVTFVNFLSLAEKHFWLEFLEAFGAVSLDEICIQGQNIFRGLNKNQKMNLKMILKELMKRGTLRETISTIRDVFYNVDPGKVTFAYFLSLAENCLWKEFLDIFNVESLDQVSIQGLHIFSNKSEQELYHLMKTVTELINRGILEKAVITLKNIFRTVPEKFEFNDNFENAEDDYFINFLRLAEVIMQYTSERATRVLDLNRMRQQGCLESYNNRKADAVLIAGVELTPYEYTIMRVLEEIRAQIEKCTLSIDFGNIIAAVYHYYKHRWVDEEEMSVEEYYKLIKENLEMIMNSDEFKSMKNDGMVIFERYYDARKRWLKIVIKKRKGRVYLSTCYYSDDIPDGTEQDGDIKINNKKFNP